MEISELAVAAYLYECFTGSDEGYGKLLEATGRNCDLAKPSHRDALIKWLRNWGCRQFAVKHHALASRELLSWHKEFGKKLPRRGAKLWELSDNDLDAYAKLFNSLARKRASVRRTKKGTSNVRIGPTGAAKILFAIRPDVFPPWDDFIRKSKGHNSPDGYARFLKDTKQLVLNLKGQCDRRNIAIGDLPKKLHRRWSSVPKLVDEYYWVTITNRCCLPVSERLRDWANWCSPR
jgi:hypothetical protein